MLPIIPAQGAPLLRACLEDHADVRWHGASYEVCGHKALVLVREYWCWTLEVARDRRPHMIKTALEEAQATQKNRLTPQQKNDVISRVDERIAQSMTAEDVPVRSRYTYNPYTETRQPEGWDQLEQRLRERWGPLWEESMTWPNPLWEQREIDWGWLDAMTGETENEPVSVSDAALGSQKELF